MKSSCFGVVLLIIFRPDLVNNNSQCTITLILTLTYKNFVQGRVTLLIKSVEQCDPTTEYRQMFNVTFKTVVNKQYVDGILILKEDLDNSLRANVSFERLTGRRYMHLFSINEKKSCEALHKYMGEFMYDMERQVQLIPGMCPIPKGRYHMHNFYLDFGKFTTIQNFPLGNMRITDRVYDKKNNVFGCNILKLEYISY